MACNCRGAGQQQDDLRGQPRSVVAAAEQRLLPLREGRMCSVAVVSGGGCDDGVLVARVLLARRASVGSFQRHFWFR